MEKLLHSIFFRLFSSYSLLTVLSLTLVGILTNYNVSNLLNNKLNEDASTWLEQKSLTLDSALNDLNRISEIVSKDQNVSDFLRNEGNNEAYRQSFLGLDNTFSGVNLIRPENIGMTLISEHGYVYYFGYSFNMDYHPSNFDWLPNESELSSGSYITKLHRRPYSNINSNELVFSYVQRIWSLDLKSSGILIIDFHRDFLSLLLSETNASQLNDAGLLITNREGELIYPETNNLFSSTDLRSLNKLKRVSDREENHYRLVTLHNANSGWNLTGYFLEDNLYEPIYFVRSSIFGAIVLIIALYILVSLTISQRISDPIKHLKNLLDKVSQGEFHHTFPVNRKDEIGALGNGYNHMIRKITELFDLVYEKQEQKRKAEIAALQAQINPHFLYNTLESINSFARKKKEMEISRMIVLLGRLLRQSISNFDETVTIEQELQYIATYIEIHNFRRQNRIIFSTEVSDEIRNLYIVKWTLQPIVENAILHGLRNEQINAKVNIKAWTDDSIVYVQVIDNGIGLSTESLEKLQYNIDNHSEQLTKSNKMGVGLFNVHTRIQLHYGKEYGILLTKAPHKGLSVTIRLPRWDRGVD